MTAHQNESSSHTLTSREYSHDHISIEAPSLNHIRKHSEQRLKYAIVLTGIIFILEVFGGIYSNSLALLADAGHMLTDLGALLISFFASRLIHRPATHHRTFGYYRAEIIAALFNGALLLTVVFGILYEAYQRLLSPEDVNASYLLPIALIGLAVNFAAGLLLYKERHESLNIKAAFIHIVSDFLGSIAATFAGVIILVEGWVFMDTIMSFFISVLILYSSLSIIREALHILMEGTPKHINLESVREALLQIPGIENVHDLHIWTVTTGVEAMSGHAVVRNNSNHTHGILLQARKVLEEKFGIHHVTLQLECCNLEHTEGDL